MDAVLFDMDGLLVDSEPVWFEVERDVFARLGADRAWTPADAHAMVGTALAAAAEHMRVTAGATTDPAAVVRWFVEGMHDRLSAGVPWKPGATRLLADLAEQGVPTALVSSSYRRLVDVVLAQLPPETFRTSVAGDEVARGKPHPDPYLVALDRLTVQPRNVVVLEDSPTGATAGAAAGCTVVVVPDLAPLPPRHPWHVVDSLEALDPAVLLGLLSSDRGEDVEVGSPARGQYRREHPDQP
jgi:HAD superfamily hydrolase (TIGR01509 family)